MLLGPVRRGAALHRRPLTTDIRDKAVRSHLCCSPREAPRGKYCDSDSATATRRSLLRDRSFRSFFVGDAVSQVGDRISELAFPLIAVLVLHASAAEVSVLTALVWLPNLASPFLGAWIDRQQHKKRLLVVADLLRAALLLTVPAAFASDALTLLQLYAVALLTGAASVLFNTTYPAFFVLLVRRPDYLAANSLLSGSRSVSFIAGPALGGALVSLVTAPVALVVDALSFVWSAVFVGRVRLHRRPEPPARGGADDLAAARGPRAGCLHAGDTRCCAPCSAASPRSTSSRSCSRRCWCCSRAGSPDSRRADRPRASASAPSAALVGAVTAPALSRPDRGGPSS